MKNNDNFDKNFRFVIYGQKLKNLFDRFLSKGILGNYKIIVIIDHNSLQ
jgi:hypothetical protein